MFDNYDSEYEPDPSDFPPGVTWEGVYELSLDLFYQAAQGPRFGITIGKGLRTAGANRGIDLLIIYPTKHPRGVLAIHAVIRLHPQTGWPMLVGVSNDHPVIYVEDGVPKRLGANQWHALCRVNHFFIGQIECMFTLSGMALAQLELWGKARSNFLTAQGLLPPDIRIPILPLQAPIKRVGSVKVSTFNSLQSRVKIVVVAATLTSTIVSHILAACKWNFWKTNFLTDSRSIQT